MIVLLAKNPAGWVETLNVIDDLLPEGRGTVVVAVNARGPDGRDPSWLWDVPFEQLAGRKVIATGEPRPTSRSGSTTPESSTARTPAHRSSRRARPRRTPS